MWLDLLLDSRRLPGDYRSPQCGLVHSADPRPAGSPDVREQGADLRESGDQPDSAVRRLPRPAVSHARGGDLQGHRAPEDRHLPRAVSANPLQRDDHGAGQADPGAAGRQVQLPDRPRGYAPRHARSAEQSLDLHEPDGSDPADEVAHRALTQFFQPYTQQEQYEQPRPTRPRLFRPIETNLTKDYL